MSCDARRLMNTKAGVGLLPLLLLILWMLVAAIPLSGCAVLAGGAAGAATGYVAGHKAGEDAADKDDDD